MSSLRLLVVDDNVQFLDTLVDALKPHFIIVGALANGESVLAQVEDLNPDIIILDISLPDINGFNVIERLRRAAWDKKVLLLSNYEQPEMVQAAFDVGASGYVFKSRMVPDLIDAINVVVSQDDFFWSSSCSSGSRKSMGRTPRE